MSRALDQCDKRAHIKNKKLVKLLLNLSKQTFYNFKWGSANDE
jgi:hypothetical protein